MSDQATQPHPTRGEMSGQSTSFRQSPWMGHWMQAKYKRPRDGSPSFQVEDGSEMNQLSLPINYVSGSKSLNAVGEAGDRGSAEVMNKPMMPDGSDLKKERKESLSFPIFSVDRPGSASCKQVAETQIGQGSKYNAVSVATVKPRRIQEMENTPNLELELRSRDSVDGGYVMQSARMNLPGIHSGFPYGVLYRREKAIPFASTSRGHPAHRPSYHDFNVETMRISDTLDPGEEIHLGLPMYARATRHFLITEKTTIGVSGEGKIFGASMLSTNFNGNFGGMLSLSQARPELKLQLLDGSTDSEQEDRCSEENQKTKGCQSIGRLDSVAGLTNETSAETRTMEVDNSMENDLPPYGGQSNASYRGKSPVVELPDMNEEALEPDGSADEGEPTASRTQSLDMGCLLSHADCPSSSKSAPRQAIIDPGLEPSSRWVKRLKLNGTKPAALGTKSSTSEEAPFEKLRKFSSNLLNRGVGSTSSEPAAGTHPRVPSPSEGGRAGKCGKASSTESLNGGRDALLSHSWIRRWRHGQTASLKKQPAPAEPSQTPKAGFDQFQKKAFPSIAAMALMGKAMNGFRPCQFTKKGSFIVWNTNGLASD
uniref:F-box protein n=2 Tax=Kalanchoe fedtschenkoi TaxID=63787 RepID=A0A7N0T874_KALFE